MLLYNKRYPKYGKKVIIDANVFKSSFYGEFILLLYSTQNYSKIEKKNINTILSK